MASDRDGAGLPGGDIHWLEQEEPTRPPTLEPTAAEPRRGWVHRAIVRVTRFFADTTLEVVVEGGVSMRLVWPLEWALPRPFVDTVSFEVADITTAFQRVGRETEPTLVYRFTIGERAFPSLHRLSFRRFGEHGIQADYQG